METRGAEMLVDGKRVINFCSNDYLGLSCDPEIKQALVEAVDCYGTGAGASQYISGYTEAHRALEQFVIEKTGFEKAICFANGYMANLAVQNVLLERGDHVFIDRLAHASIYDSAILSRARLHRYPHVDVATLDQQLEKYAGDRSLVVTDGVFSMDGDIAPLARLEKLAKEHGAGLFVDDAHGLGVLGKGGRGSVEECGLDAGVPDLCLATFGKACGVYGAYVAGRGELIGQLEQKARTLIYTTALPPAIAAASRRGLEKALQESWRRDQLNETIGIFREGAAQLSLPVLPSRTPIQPVLLYEDRVAVEASRRLFDAGFMVSAIRPPTVPEGRSRLRITLSTLHTRPQIDQLLEALDGICKENR